jgi:3-oxoacyl-[acyl-carrier protein] reductase
MAFYPQIWYDGSNIGQRREAPMKTALITGGSRGIGAAAVRAFARAGYRVAFLYLSSEQAAEALGRETGALPFQCDMGESGQVEAAVLSALRALCHIDVLIHSAGIAEQKLLTDVTDQEWRRMFAVHVDGAFYAARAVLPSMISRKEGQIVLLSSMWGQVGASMEVPYSAAKAALIGMTRALAKEVAPSGIRVNCVAPGVIHTDMLAEFDDETLRALAEETPLGRLGTAEEVAETLEWLCSDKAGFLTGQVVGVNGGMVMG